MSTWTDFNDAEQQQGFDLLPHGTLARVRLSIKPGGFDDPSQGWTGGWATRNVNSGAVYLKGEFTLLEGPYARRKIWSLIGLHSPKGPDWGRMGRSLVRAMLNSARGVNPGDTSEAAAAARRIRGIGDLEGLEFVARIEVEEDSYSAQGQRNVIKSAVEPDHRDYPALMGRVPAVAAPAASAASAPAAPDASVAASPAPATTKPVWAQ